MEFSNTEIKEEPDDDGYPQSTETMTWQIAEVWSDSDKQASNPWESPPSTSKISTSRRKQQHQIRQSQEDAKLKTAVQGDFAAAINSVVGTGGPDVDTTDPEQPDIKEEPASFDEDKDSSDTSDGDSEESSTLQQMGGHNAENEQDMTVSQDAGTAYRPRILKRTFQQATATSKPEGKSQMTQTKMNTNRNISKCGIDISGITGNPRPVLLVMPVSDGLIYSPTSQSLSYTTAQNQPAGSEPAETSNPQKVESPGSFESYVCCSASEQPSVFAEEEHSESDDKGLHGWDPNMQDTVRQMIRKRVKKHLNLKQQTPAQAAEKPARKSSTNNLREFFIELPGTNQTVKIRAEPTTTAEGQPKYRFMVVRHGAEKSDSPIKSSNIEQDKQSVAQGCDHLQEAGKPSRTSPAVSHPILHSVLLTSAHEASVSGSVMSNNTRQGKKNSGVLDSISIELEDKDLWTALTDVVRQVEEKADEDGEPVASLICIRALSSLLSDKLNSLNKPAPRQGVKSKSDSPNDPASGKGAASSDAAQLDDDTGKRDEHGKNKPGSAASETASKKTVEALVDKLYGRSEGMIYESCACGSMSKQHIEEREMWQSIWENGKSVNKLHYLEMVRFMGSNIFTFEKMGLLFMNLGELFWRSLLPRRMSEFQTIVDFLDEIPESIPKSEFTIATCKEDAFLCQFLGKPCMSHINITPYALRAIYERLGELHGMETWEVYSQALFYKQHLGHQCAWTLQVTPPTVLTHHAAAQDCARRYKRIAPAHTHPLQPMGVPAAFPRVGQLAFIKQYAVEQFAGKSTQVKSWKEFCDGGAGTSLDVKGVTTSLSEALNHLILDWKLIGLVKPFCSCKLDIMAPQTFQPLTFDKIPLSHITEMKFLDLDCLHCWKRPNGFFVSLVELRVFGMLPPPGHEEVDMLLASPKKGDICHMLKMETVFLSLYGYTPEEVLEEEDGQQSDEDASAALDLPSCSTSNEKPSTRKKVNEKTLLLNVCFLHRIYQTLSKIEGTYVPHAEGIFYVKYWLHDCLKETENLDKLEHQEIPNIKQEVIDIEDDDEEEACNLPIVFASAGSSVAEEESQNVTSPAENIREKVQLEALKQETENENVTRSAENILKKVKLEAIKQEAESEKTARNVKVKQEKKLPAFMTESDTNSRHSEVADGSSDESKDCTEKDILFSMSSYPRSCSCPENENANYPLKSYSIKQCMFTKSLTVLSYAGQAVIDNSILFTFKTDKQIFFSVSQLLMCNILQNHVTIEELTVQSPRKWHRFCNSCEKSFLAHHCITVTQDRVTQMMISAELLCFLSYRQFVTRRVGLKQSDIHLHHVGHICPDRSSLAYKALTASTRLSVLMSAWTKSFDFISRAEAITQIHQSSPSLKERIDALSGLEHCEVPPPPPADCEEVVHDTKKIMHELTDCVLMLKRCYGKDLMHDSAPSTAGLVHKDTEYFICSPRWGQEHANIDMVITYQSENKSEEEPSQDASSSVFFGAMVPKDFDMSKSDLRGHAFLTENDVMSLIGENFSSHHVILVGTLCICSRKFTVLKVNGKLYLNWGECTTRLLGVNTIYSLAQELWTFFYKVPHPVLVHLAASGSEMQHEHLNAIPWICVNSLTAVYCLGIMNHKNISMFPKTFSLLWQIFVETAQQKIQYRSFVLIPKVENANTESVMSALDRTELKGKGD